MLQAAAVFSDNMVLQRDKKLRVFGRGDEGSRITVALCGKTGDTVCRDGKWVVYLPRSRRRRERPWRFQTERTRFVLRTSPSGRSGLQAAV